MILQLYDIFNPIIVQLNIIIDNSHPTLDSSIHFTPMMEYGGLIATGEGKMIFSLCHEDISLSLEIVKNTTEIITAHSSRYINNVKNCPNTNEKKSKNQNLSYLLMNRLVVVFVYIYVDMNMDIYLYMYMYLYMCIGTFMYI
jgi:hypothetical protein